MTLNALAWLALAIVAGVMCALLFATGGTTQYWQAWTNGDRTVSPYQTVGPSLASFTLAEPPLS